MFGGGATLSVQAPGSQPTLVSHSICGIISGMGHNHHGHHSNLGMHVTPTGVNKVYQLISGCFWLVRSGIHPNQFEPRACYDRTIRIVGGILILVGILWGLIGLAIQNFSR
jgi:hypothetical protein